MKEKILTRQDNLRRSPMDGCSLWAPILSATGEPEKAGGRADTARENAPGHPQNMGTEYVAEEITGKA